VRTELALDNKKYCQERLFIVGRFCSYLLKIALSCDWGGDLRTAAIGHEASNCGPLILTENEWEPK
jgi:hypothetical protein